VEEAEKIAILRALKETKNKKVKTAHLLGIDYKTLVNKMSKLDIH
jgi:transcriptional regulator with PAS, ATPase and Fis domain